MDDLHVFHIKTGNFMGDQNGIELTPPWHPAGRNKNAKGDSMGKKQTPNFVSRDRPLQTT
jgi:hypothetical protein